MLSQQHCVPCEGGTKPFTVEKIHEYLPLVPGWVSVKDTQITREFSFKDFKETIRFVNSVADIAETEGHHPDLNVHNWNKLTITLSTHAIGGLSENDFILAVKINAFDH